MHMFDRFISRMMPHHSAGVESIYSHRMNMHRSNGVLDTYIARQMPMFGSPLRFLPLALLITSVAAIVIVLAAKRRKRRQNPY